MTTKRKRLLNQDGTFNTRRRGIQRSPWVDLYHKMLSVGWKQFLVLVVVSYVVVNFLFALAYLACGPDALQGAVSQNLAGRFWNAYFFSVQTLATIGYGKITPSGLAANLLVTLEALFGLAGVALATGILFARFSRPTARVVFSKHAVINSHDGVRSMIFRIANLRLNQIVDAAVSVVLAVDEQTSEGERYRNFYDLKLERDRSPIFAMSWTVVHPMTDQSPMKGWTKSDFKDKQAEVFVNLTGIDDTFSATIHARFSYIPDEILFDHYFHDIISVDADGTASIDLSKIHESRMMH